MWTPNSYEEVEQAVAAKISEGPDLDFKEKLSDNKELAKDVAAMTIHGGVIVVGVSEADGVASAIPKVPLAGMRERIQQIIDTSVRPIPHIEIGVYAEKTGDAEGVVVVAVPPSINAPHEADSRFPARSDTTTRYQIEPEIARLYEQRRQYIERPLATRQPFEGFIYPSGSAQAAGFGGIGRMRVLIRPLGDAAHAAGVRLRKPLEEAVASAAASLATEFDPPKALGLLREWRPHGSLGWESGVAKDQVEELRVGVLAAGVATYPAQLSFLVTMSIQNGRREAFEHLWLQELLALLSISGYFFEEVPGAALLSCEVELWNLDRATSSLALHYSLPSNTETADTTYIERSLFTPRELVNEPARCAGELLERWLVSFVPEQIDVAGAVRLH
jgi:hypothetical protein